MAAKGGKDDDKKRPIIKKIKKVAGHGHHGGAWKVAYADFVTAMMAFFLLLWLLSTSSKSKLEGIAEFFTPTTGIKDSQGIGVNGGISQTTDGKAVSNKSDPSISPSTNTPSGITADNVEKARVEGEEENQIFAKGQSAVEQAVAQDKELNEYKDNISVTMTPDGLKIDVMDTEKYPMFKQGTSELTEHGQTVLSKLTQVIKRMPNHMAITGNTDGSPAETSKGPDYTNWELSGDRASAARRFMIKSGMEEERPKRVVGMADKELAFPKEPRNPRNRRISLLLMRGTHMLIPDSAVPDDSRRIAPEMAPAAPSTPAAAEPAPEGH